MFRRGIELLQLSFASRTCARAKSDAAHELSGRDLWSFSYTRGVPCAKVIE